jgi:insertion element IS1 protein InsB
MVLMPVRCPQCHSDQVIKGGVTKAGKQRYRGQHANCPRYSFVLDPSYQGHVPEVKEQIIDMALNGSGIRDTTRVLKISPTTVINELKKRVGTQQCKPATTGLVKPRRGGSGHAAR